MPSEEKHQHQKHETSKKPESTPPDLINHGAAGWLLFGLELFVKFFALLSILFTLYLFWNIIENSNDFVFEWSWIGTFLLLQWILWIPAIGFLCYSLGTNKWNFLWNYLWYYGVFQFINFVNCIIGLFSWFYPSFKEAISYPRAAGEFHIISIMVPYIFMNCCWFFVELVKDIREELEKPEQ